MFLFWQDIAHLQLLSASGSEYLALLKIWGISVYKVDFTYAYHQVLLTVWEPPHHCCGEMRLCMLWRYTHKPLV